MSYLYTMYFDQIHPLYPSNSLRIPLTCHLSISPFLHTITQLALQFMNRCRALSWRKGDLPRVASLKKTGASSPVAINCQQVLLYGWGSTPILLSDKTFPKEMQHTHLLTPESTIPSANQRVLLGLLTRLRVRGYLQEQK